MVYKIMSSMVDGLFAFVRKEPLVTAIIAYILYQLYLNHKARPLVPGMRSKGEAAAVAPPTEAMETMENTEAIADYFDRVPQQESDEETRLNAELLAYDAAATEHEYFVATDPTWNHRSANENSVLVA